MLTTAQIIRELRGTKINGYADGLMQGSRRDIEAVARTALGHMAQFTQNRFVEANQDIIKCVVWCATLDTRTSPPCRARDGKQYTPVEHKPIGHSFQWGGGPGGYHWRCRSHQTTVLKSNKELGIDVPDVVMKDGTRASMDGQLPADVTYSQWIKKQSAARQDEVLGATRAQMMREGKITPEQLYGSKGEYLTLDQLKSKTGGMLGSNNASMKSEELAIRAADLTEPKLSAVQREARAYVVENGRKTGHEYGVAIADGKIVDRFTSGMPNALKVPKFNGYPNGVIDLHHNHPVGDSLSAQDFATLLATPSIGSVAVHGQSGFFTQAAKVGVGMSSESAYLVAASTRSKAKALVAEARESGVISDAQSNSGLWPVVMASLLENDGLIRYTINSETVMSIARKVINHGK